MYKRLHVSGIAPAKRGVPVLLHVFAVEIISIHAPVWGRAFPAELVQECDGISIHAPVWGRAEARLTGEGTRSYFNSRPRVGAGLVAPVVGGSEAISIHAPVWGRGKRLTYSTSSVSSFQFTPPCGGGRPPCQYHRPPIYFNSRPRVGGGRVALLRRDKLLNFNSRPRVGGSHSTSPRLARPYFNSRPRMGAGYHCPRSPGHLKIQCIRRASRRPHAVRPSSRGLGCAHICLLPCRRFLPRCVRSTAATRDVGNSRPEPTRIAANNRCHPICNQSSPSGSAPQQIGPYGLL